MENTDLMLQQAIAAARAGKTGPAKVIATRVLNEEPDNVTALLLMSTLAETPASQVEYLNQVLAIDPQNQMASARLVVLSEKVSEPTGEPEVEPPAMVVAPVVAAEGPEEVDDLPEAVDEEAELADLLDEAAAEWPMDDSDEWPFESEESAEEEESGGVAETIVGAAAVAGTGVSRDDASLMDQAEGNTIPDWIVEEVGFESAVTEPTAEAGVAEEQDQAEPELAPAEMAELPDWLLEGPDESWKDIDESAFSTPTPQVVPTGVDDTPKDDVSPKKAAPKPKKRSTRGLEIVLALLVLVAFVIIAVLVYLILYPPA